MEISYPKIHFSNLKSYDGEVVVEEFHGIWNPNSI